MSDNYDDLPAADVNEIEPVETDAIVDDESPNAFQYQFPDVLLQQLVHAVNEAEPAARIGVTLVVGGEVVSGQLCSYAEYLAEQTRLLAGLATDDIPFIEQARGIFADTDSTGGWPGQPFHLHLLDASTGGVSLAPWRGRLIDVAGWSFGTPNFS